jgi:chromosome partitioning protein
MKVISLASAKGGASKSTMTLHLAVAATEAGLKTAIIDTDPQGTLGKWWNERKAETPAMASGAISVLANTLRSLDKDLYDIVFIDTPPQTTASIGAVIALSDLILIPVRPSLADLWSVGSTIDIARKHSKPFAFILAQATRGATITTQTMAALSEHGPVTGVMHHRVGYAAILGSGEALSEQEPRSQGAKEMAGIWANVLPRLNASPSARKPAKTTSKKVLIHA